MIILVILAISLIVAMLRGGQIGRLADLNIQWRGLVLAGFLIQILVFQPYWQENNETKALTQLAYFISLTLLTIALVKNRHIPGMPLLTLGLVLNFAAIASNGGYMPASPAALELAGRTPLAVGQVYNNSIGAGSTTNLIFLCDIFAIPKGFIFPNVFSIGDVLIAFGAVWLTQNAMVRPSAQIKP